MPFYCFKTEFSIRLLLFFLFVGTAMNMEKRQALRLQGLSPSRVENVELQKRRALRLLRSKPTMLEKYLFLAQMRTSNVRLFYKMIMDELEEMAPVIYTPTVGTACLEYSNIYPFLAGPGVPDGLYLTKDSYSKLCETIKNYQPFGFGGCFQPDIAVISDGSRILGLGDLGVNGMGIPIGKLQLYVAAAGIDPRKTLPIILDLGTNNEALRQDDFYLGLRQPRPSDQEVKRKKGKRKKKKKKLVVSQKYVYHFFFSSSHSFMKRWILCSLLSDQCTLIS